ncbi:MAG: NfeD family protein [Bryobacteraceae bacterium]|nr:NfeD family protein [Bryobacteraceae bacterium]
MSWWVWVLFGFALLLAELLTPGGFYLLFFGVGAMAVGVTLWFLPLGITLQVLLFGCLSLGTLAVFRRRLVAMRETNMPRVDHLADETAFALDDIPAGAYGKAELRGSSWNAWNVGDQPVQRQQRCRVEKVDGLTLWIRA